MDNLNVLLVALMDVMTIATGPGNLLMTLSELSGRTQVRAATVIQHVY